MNTPTTETLYEQLGISKEVWAFGQKTEEKLKERFEEFDRNAEYNQLKVIHAMQENRVSEGCFNYVSGYGYNDQGRDTLEDVYASVFHTEAALVRPQITCGTHALALALAANLRPGDTLLSPVGKPYDTLEEVIGIRPSNGSLAEYGISYKQVELLILPVADDAFHILAQSDRISEFIIAPLIQFNFQDVVLRNILRKEILEKQVKKQYGLSTSAYACDNLYLAVPHTMNQSIHISISINHSIHLVLRTKLSELLCVVYHAF